MEEMQQRLRRFGLEQPANRFMKVDLTLSHRAIRKGGGVHVSGRKARGSEGPQQRRDRTRTCSGAHAGGEYQGLGIGAFGSEGQPLLYFWKAEGRRGRDG